MAETVAALRIDPSGACTTVSVPKRNTHRAKQEDAFPGIDGRVNYMQVELSDMFLDFWHDEEFLCKGLPANPLATELYHRLQGLRTDGIRNNQVWMGTIVLKKRGLDQHIFAVEEPTYSDLGQMDPPLKILAQIGAAPSSKAFSEGDVVTVIGLKAKPEHNGQSARVVGHQGERVQIRLANGVGLAVRHENLARDA